MRGLTLILNILGVLIMSACLTITAICVIAMFNCSPSQFAQYLVLFVLSLGVTIISIFTTKEN